MTIASVAVGEVLLILKILFLVLLYLFIWRIVRGASRDVRAPQESMILSPAQAAELLGQVQRPEGGRLVVVRSPALPEGSVHALNSAALTAGRAEQSDLTLGNDAFASARHARFEPRFDGVWVEDAGSTNGTFVNGVRLARARRLEPGDVVRIGETELRFER